MLAHQALLGKDFKFLYCTMLSRPLLFLC